MSSAPATLDTPAFSAGAFPTAGIPDLVFDDTALLDGAASVWVTLKYARTLPAIPETQASLKKAEALFLAELAKCGFGAADVERRVGELRAAEGARRGVPPCA
jgi:hypothetical protein